MKTEFSADHQSACARVAARFREPWLRIYARRKLQTDPAFAAAFQLFRNSSEPVVDVGCGVGLLAFYLRERKFNPRITGLERDRRKIVRAEEVARSGYRDLEFIEQDIREPIATEGHVVLFDLLHYLQPEEQGALLSRLAADLTPGALLVIRDCPRDRSTRFWLTHLAERFAQYTTWNLRTPLHFPRSEHILASFPSDEFTRSVAPLWGRTPFNNHLFVFRRRAAATVPA